MTSWWTVAEQGNRNDVSERDTYEKENFSQLTFTLCLHIIVVEAESIFKDGRMVYCGL